MYWQTNSNVHMWRYCAISACARGRSNSFMSCGMLLISFRRTMMATSFQFSSSCRHRGRQRGSLNSPKQHSIRH